MLFREDRINTYILMIKNDCSITLVQRQWRKLYSSNPPTDKNLKQINKKFMNTRIIHDWCRIEIRRHFEEQPTSSIRRASTELNIPRETIRRTLRHIIGMRTFHYIVTICRLKFCQLMKNKVQAHPTFKNLLSFPDEATFYSCRQKSLDKHLS